MQERDFGPFVLDETISVSEYAHGILKKYVQLAFGNENGARIGDNPEFIHHMRVSLRKVLTAFKVFKKYISPEVKHYKKFLRHLISSLGETRDLDVQIASVNNWIDMATIDEHEVNKELVDYLRLKRVQAQEQIISLFDQETYKQTLSNLERLLRSHAPSKYHKAADPMSVYYKIIAKRIHQLQKIGDKLQEDSLSSDFHRLRIRGKKLRYTLEFFEPIYGKTIRKMIKKMSLMQHELGIINDCHVAKERLLNLIGKKPTQFSPICLHGIGEASIHYSATEKEKRHSFIDAYKKIDWDQFLEITRDSHA